MIAKKLLMKILFLGPIAVFGVTSCVFATDKDSDVEPKDGGDSVEGARVGAKWQRTLLDSLKASKDSTEAWGLFSEGGWLDGGQVMAFQGPKVIKVDIVRPGKKAVTSSRELTNEEAEKFRQALKSADTLSDLDEKAFDGVIYEYVHVSRVGEATKILRRTFIRRGGTKPAPEHDALVAAFAELRKVP